MISNAWVFIPEKTILYQVRHRIMEGDCQVEHGPTAVHIPGFYILRYPVTNGQYLEFVRQTGYTSPDGTNFLAQLSEGLTAENEDLPVTFVSPEDAAAYAAYLGAQLPTEAQWQYAAEGDTPRRWPWGDTYCSDLTNDSPEGLKPVNRFPGGASPFGVMDLCGNAWEWTRDIIDDGTHRFTLLRGGSCYRGEHFWHFAGGPHPIHSHEKFPLLAGNFNRAATISFRCVKEAE